MTSFFSSSKATIDFNPRTPLQSAIKAYCNVSREICISIHALRYRVRCSIFRRRVSQRRNFNPRTPLQSAILVIVTDNAVLKTDFNPRTPLQSAIYGTGKTVGLIISISIHALRYRVRSLIASQIVDVTFYFNPRTPLQSAIMRFVLCCAITCYFNPRTPLQSAIARYCGSSLKYSFSMQSCD